MRTVSLVLVMLAAIGVAVVSGSGTAPASEEAPLAPVTISYLFSSDRANPGVCTDPDPMSSVGLDSGSLTLPASLVLTTAGDYCESHGDCATGEECDFDLNECVEPNNCRVECGWFPTGRCEWKCYGHDNDTCIDERYVCEYERKCWIECDD